MSGQSTEFFTCYFDLQLHVYNLNMHDISAIVQIGMKDLYNPLSNTFFQKLA